jgi:SHS2 domain-containing protein
MEKFTFLEHTADAKFQAFGKTCEEAFSNAALAMFSIMTDTNKIKNKIKKSIEVKGKDKQELLYNFLEEILFFLDTDGFLLNKVSKINIKESKKQYDLTATIEGDTHSDKYDVHGEVKAVTYNQMFVKKEGNKCIVQVVVDL